MEADRRLHEGIGKVADRYADLAQRRIDGGPHALALLGLEQLGSDKAIREAIRQMRVRAGAGFDPWAGNEKHVEDIDLLAFFRFVRERNVDFFAQSVESVAAQVRSYGGLRAQ